MENKTENGMIYNVENMQKLGEKINGSIYKTPKVLIVGQAPSNQFQDYPYSTTMLYDWLDEIGINKRQAQNIFDFDAVYNKFPGRDEKGGHAQPTQEQMDSYWPTLEAKIQGVNKVILLGNVAKNYFYSKPKTWSCNLEVLELIHPSKMNFNRYNKNKELVLAPLRKFLREQIEYCSPLNPRNYNPDLVYPENSIKD